MIEIIKENIKSLEFDEDFYQDKLDKTEAALLIFREQLQKIEEEVANDF